MQMNIIKMLADRVFEVLKKGKCQLKDDEFGVFTLKELVEKIELLMLTF